MMSVQPGNVLPERRIITADSFRALKLKLVSSSRPTAVPPPVIVAPEVPPPPAVTEVIEMPPPEPAGTLAAVDLEEALRPAETEEALATSPEMLPEPVEAASPEEPGLDQAELEATAIAPMPADIEAEEPVTAPVELPEQTETVAASEEPSEAEALPPARVEAHETASMPLPVQPPDPGFTERRVLEKPQQPEDDDAGERAHALLDIMALPTEGSLPQERALANDTLLRLVPRMPLRSLRHLAERVCMMEVPSQMLVRRLINDPRIEVSGPLLEHALTVDDSDLIALAHGRNPAKLKLMARRRIISPALAEALIRSNDVDTLVNLVRNAGASFSIEAMWHLTRMAAAHPVLQAPLVTRQDTPSPIAFQLFWRLPSELRRYVLSRFLTDSETITRILSMNRENDGRDDRKYVDLSLLSRLAEAGPEEAGEIYAKLTHVSVETGARIADDQGGEALTVALKAAGLTRAQFAGMVESRADAEALKSIFETLSFNKARVLLTYWDWAVRRTGPYARIASS